VLDFPDNKEESFRSILIKQDDRALEELAKKPKNEIITFLFSEKKKELREEKWDTLVEASKTVAVEKQETKEQDVENTIQNEVKNLKDKENQRAEQKLSKIKQAFPQSILDKNPDIADKFKLVDSSKDPAEKDKILQEILQTLKNP